MDLSTNIIIIKDQLKTKDVESISDNGEYYSIRFNGGDTDYTYSKNNVIWLQNYEEINIKLSDVFIHCEKASDVKKLYKGEEGGIKCYVVEFKKKDLYTKRYKLYRISDIRIENSGDKKLSNKLLNYFKESAKICKIEDDTQDNNDETIGFLEKNYSHISIRDIEADSAIALYLKAAKSSDFLIPQNQITYENPIIPFGSNRSQTEALHKALNSRFSIIQGPPGTGKTNTILNIIANLILHEKSVLIVSGNNSATNNILKKLEQNGFGFIAAPLGNLENKDRFIENNPIPIPDMTLWSQDSNGAQEMLNSSYQDLDRIFKLREDIAGYKHELAECQLERKHFEQELLGNKFSPADSSTIMPSKRIQSRIHILQHLASLIYNDGKPNIYDFKRALQQSFRTLQYRWLFDLRGKITIKSIEELIQNHNRIFYINRERELNDLISYTEDILTNLNAEKINADVTSASLKIFKAFLASNYSYERQKYTDIFSNGKNFIKDYPIVLSTTFSACRCFKKDTQFDYIIMDEASQVSIESAIPALTCAHNAVIVGDTKQLSNIRKNKEKNKLLELEAKLKIPSGYSCANHSFLSSVLKTLPDAPVTLLREHYRCHPDIINFCNRKFYDGKLLIMTERKSNERALSMITTSKGNHSRHHENQREIDVIEEEISNSLKEKDDIGLIAPYKDQVKLMGKDLTLLKNNDDNKASTVHAFQGQEKKTIILSVTDDYITEFSDNPNLINVALSRAIEKFHLVVSGNEQKLHGNIYDLMDYIRYNNGEVRESALNSIFDNLHRYSSQNYAPGQTESSPAEDLTSELIEAVLQTEFKGANLNYLRHYPLGALIAENGNTDTGSKTAMSQELKNYVKAVGTHLDFLIYNELTKNAVLAVEVDGVSYHKEGTKQYERDKKKNEVLEICKLPLLRLNTKKHSEREGLIKMIKDAIGRKEYGQNNPHLHQVNNPHDSNTSSQS